MNLVDKILRTPSFKKSLQFYILSTDSAVTASGRLIHYRHFITCIGYIHFVYFVVYNIYSCRKKSIYTPLYL